MSKPSVALLGLGTMGNGMAQNLLKAGFPLTVWNRTRAKAEPFAAQGAKVVDSPAEAVKGANVVIAMLSDDDASRAAWLGENGALAAMEKDSVAVESSTLSPEWITELNEAAEKLGVKLIEGPVTGSRPQAEAGQLTFLAGGDKDVLESIKPVLASMSKEVVHLGPVGGGGQLKLINNFLCGVQVASFAEGLAWIERTGLNLEAALEFLKKGAPGSGIFNAMSERMTKRTYEVNFLLRLMAKDMRYATAAAEELGIDLTTSEAPKALFARAQEEGYGEKDMSAVVEVVRGEKA